MYRVKDIISRFHLLCGEVVGSNDAIVLGRGGDSLDSTFVTTQTLHTSLSKRKYVMFLSVHQIHLIKGVICVYIGTMKLDTMKSYEVVYKVIS